jgi:hypothetical protein
MEKSIIKMKIINQMTGQIKTVRDNLYYDHFSKIKNNGAPVWTVHGEVEQVIKAEAAASLNVKTMKVERTPLPEIVESKNECEEIKTTDCKGKSDDCCKAFKEPVIEFCPYRLDADELKQWLIDNGVKFPSFTKKLESLQKYIPEIYVKK